MSGIYTSTALLAVASALCASCTCGRGVPPGAIEREAEGAFSDVASTVTGSADTATECSITVAASLREGERLVRFDLAPLTPHAKICALSNQGAIYCWGAVQVGSYRFECQHATFVAWHSDAFTGCAVLSNGAGRCWKSPYTDARGRSPDSFEWLPASYEARDLRDVAQTAGGDACFRASSGRRDCFGLNGRLVTTRAPLEGGTGAQFITREGYMCGSLRSCMVTWEPGFKAIDCIGPMPDALSAATADGVLGVGPDRRRLRSCDASSGAISDVARFDRDVRALSSADDRVCVLLSDGDVQCWGNSRTLGSYIGVPLYVEGMLGVECGDVVVAAPRSVPGGPFDGVVTSGDRTCVIVRATGRALCFGEPFESNAVAEFRDLCPSSH